jgi:hypothetical protein
LILSNGGWGIGRCNDDEGKQNSTKSHCAAVDEFAVGIEWIVRKEKSEEVVHNITESSLDENLIEVIERTHRSFQMRSHSLKGHHIHQQVEHSSVKVGRSEQTIHCGMMRKNRKKRKKESAEIK